MSVERLTRIPRIIHQIWVGPNPVPRLFAEFAEGWKKLHPEWEYRLWDNDSIKSLDTYPLILHADGPGAQGDIIRLETVLYHGGVYVDMDFEPIKPIDELLEGIEAFTARAESGQIYCGLFGAVPGHRWLRDQYDDMWRVAWRQSPPWGPVLMHNWTNRHPEVTVFPPEFFYPYEWQNREGKLGQKFPGSYAVHHWAATWSKEHNIVERFQ